MIFVGIDWAERHHDECVIDTDGQLLTKARIVDGLDGLARLHALIGKHAADPDEVVVGCTSVLAWWWKLADCLEGIDYGDSGWQAEPPTRQRRVGHQDQSTSFVPDHQVALIRPVHHQALGHLRPPFITISTTAEVWNGLSGAESNGERRGGPSLAAGAS